MPIHNFTNMDMKQLNELYSPKYFIDMGYGIDKKREASYKQEKKEIYKRYTPPLGDRKIYDYGCGTGDFLSCFDDTWKKYGYDVSDYAKEKAWRKDITIILPDEATSDHFNVIVFRGTIQHIDNPVKALMLAYDMLKPNGLLAILATPNTESIGYQLFKTLPALDPPRNWFIPGVSELKNVLANIGFCNIEARFPYWNSPYANPPKDLLYFLLSFFKYRKHPFPKNMMEIYAYAKK